MRPWWAGGRRPRGRGNLDRLGILRGDLAGWRDGIETAELAAGRPAARRSRCAGDRLRDWSPNDQLTSFLDRCLMAHGVEGRTPFLDPVVASSPRPADAFKVRKGLGQGKWLLRRWVERHVPQAEPFAKKRGFTVPVGDWIARRGASSWGRRGVPQAGVREICLPGAAETLFRAARRRHEAFAQASA